MHDYLGFAYAMVVAGGGIMGYVQAKSIPSLAAGLVFGTVIGFGAYQVSAHDRVSVSLVTSAALGGMMGYRAYNSGKFMPAGLITAISLAMLIYYAVLGYLFYRHVIGAGTDNGANVDNGTGAEAPLNPTAPAL